MEFGARSSGDRFIGFRKIFSTSTSGGGVFDEFFSPGNIKTYWTLRDSQTEYSNEDDVVTLGLVLEI